MQFMPACTRVSSAFVVLGLLPRPAQTASLLHGFTDGLVDARAPARCLLEACARITRQMPMPSPCSPRRPGAAAVPARASSGLRLGRPPAEREHV